MTLCFHFRTFHAVLTLLYYSVHFLKQSFDSRFTAKDTRKFDVYIIRF